VLRCNLNGDNQHYDRGNITQHKNVDVDLVLDKQAHMLIRKHMLFLLLLTSSSAAFAQSKIEGKVTNKKSEALPFANVLLLNASDSVFAKGVVADAEGKYRIENVKAGSYLLVATVVGFEKKYNNLLCPPNAQSLELDILLEDSSIELNAVTVESERPMFEQKIDRLVVNVQNSVTSAGNTALEVLQKSPGIVVNRQNGTISMNGKAGVRVMLNGKLVQLPIDAVVQMLDGMNASNIEKIELITAPPARYDAEGDAGIVHIVLKESTDIGTSGSAGATLGYRWAEGYAGNFNVNHRRSKSAYFVDYSMTSNRNLHIWEMMRQSQTNEASFVQLVNDTSIRKNLMVVHNFRTGAEWKVSKRSSLHILLTAFQSRWSMDADTHNHEDLDADTKVYTRMDLNEINRWQSATGGLRWLTSLNDKSDLSIDFDYLFYRNNNPSDYNNLRISTTEPEENEIIDVQKSTPMNFLVGKIDYTYHPATSFNWEAGIKVVRSSLDNDVTVDFTVDNVTSRDPMFTSFAHLDEKIGAAYLSGKYQARIKVQMNAGLRYEHTLTTITTPTEGKVLDRNYGYLFPSFFIRKELTPHRDISFSYSRRITRPTFRDIAPFVLFWNPTTFSSGNTALWPAISDGFKVGYHNKSWILSLQFNHSRHEISFFQPTLDETTNTLILRSENLRYLNSLNLSNSWSFSATKWWEVQTNFTVQYQQAETEHLERNTSIELYNLDANIVNVIKLNKTVTLEVSGYYISRAVMGISEFLPRGSLNAGIQKKFGTKSTLRLGIDDILYTSLWRVKTDLDQLKFNSQINYDWHMQFVRISYTYNFGNKKLRSVNIQTGSDEERKRVN
jgi:hypothetical protein